MPRSVEQYTEALMLLLPRGEIWREANVEQLAASIAPEFRRIESRIEDLIEESDPQTVTDLIGDWEQDWGLPTACTGPLALLVERRNALVSRMIGIANQSRQTYIDRAASGGYVVTITEYSSGESVPGMPALPAVDSAFAVQINAPLDTVQFRTYPSPYGEAYANWGNDLLECTLKEVLQSHEILIFSYT